MFNKLVLTTPITDVIIKNYEFRRNIVQQILGAEYVEYKHVELDDWQPFSKFVRYERERIVKESEQYINKQLLNIVPDWIIEKLAFKLGLDSEEYSSNPNYLKILHESPYLLPAKKFKEKNRKTVDVVEGEKCYICLGISKKLGVKYYSVKPCVVESKNVSNGKTTYSVFVIKIDSKTKRVVYHGRHIVNDDEIGRTPDEAVHNTAKSQIIY